MQSDKVTSVMQELKKMPMAQISMNKLLIVIRIRFINKKPMKMAIWFMKKMQMGMMINQNLSMIQLNRFMIQLNQFMQKIKAVP